MPAIKILEQKIPNFNQIFKEVLKGEKAFVTEKIYKHDCDQKIYFLVFKYGEKFYFVDSEYYDYSCIQNITEEELFFSYFLKTEKIVNLNVEKYIDDNIIYYKNYGYKDYLYSEKENIFYKYHKIFFSFKIKIALKIEELKILILKDHKF